MPSFKFELGQRIRLVASEEFGNVIGRCEYLGESPRYWVRYKDAMKCQQEVWLSESAFVAAEKEA